MKKRKKLKKKISMGPLHLNEFYLSESILEHIYKGDFFKEFTYFSEISEIHHLN